LNFKFEKFEGGFTSLVIFANSSSYFQHINHTVNWVNYTQVIELANYLTKGPNYVVGTTKDTNNLLRSDFADLVFYGAPVVASFGDATFGWY
jgi:hypothetical protein